MKDLIRKILLEYEIPNPVPGNKNVTSGYGNRKHPTTREQKMHYGMDISVPCDTDLKAPASGKVIEVGQSNDGCGGSIRIQHNGFQTRYCHLKRIFVNKNEKIFQGEVIGKTGGGKDVEGAGTSTGCHLHIELKEGTGGSTPIDPRSHFKLNQDPTPTGNETISKGVSSLQIKTFKCFLKHGGYDENLTIDTNFDDKTEAAVKKLQQELGLSETGIITPNMIPLIKDKIQSLSASIRSEIQNCYNN